MNTTANSILSIPSFAAYVEDRKYIKNVSPKTLAWFNDAWKPFGPHLEPVLASGGRIVKGGVKLDHWGGEKVYQFTGGRGLGLKDLRGWLERRPATRLAGRV